MSQGPRTRVRLDGQVYRVLRGGQGTIIYKRDEAGQYVQMWHSRKLVNVPPEAQRVLDAEARIR